MWSARNVVCVCLVSCVLVRASWAKPTEETEHRADQVDTRRGTDSGLDFSRGNTFPATALPFGFNAWTPITQTQSHKWLYTWASDTFYGLALTHQASPWLRDYGTLQVMAHVGHVAAEPQERGVPFEHAQESARPHRYGVRLSNGIEMAVTPTDHAALMTFDFPDGASSFLSFDDAADTRGMLDVDVAAGTLSGHTTSDDYDHGPHTIYIFAKLRHARIIDYGRLPKRHLGLFIALERHGQTPVELAIGTSWVSLEAARLAMADEVGEARQDHLTQAARDAWDMALSSITVEGATAQERRMFYNNLYRTLLYPTSMTEGARGPNKARYHSPYDHAVHEGGMHINNGFWDTYRAVWPLHLLLRPTEAGSMLQSFINAYQDSGWTPRWSAPGHVHMMLGTHLGAVLADAYLKGVRNFDVEAGFAASLKDATVISPYGDRGRAANHVAPFYGYVPDEAAKESAAWHLEDCVSDYAVSRWAKALGRADDAAYLDYKSGQYRNNFSPEVGFFRGRRQSGAWRTSDAEFSPTAWGYEFIEGAPWHYIMPAPFDALGTARLYGGPKAMGDKLDAMFAAPRGYDVGSYGRIIHEMTEAYDANCGQYAHANEPVHHLIWMYNSIGRPDAAQKHVRAILDPNQGIYTSGVDNGGGYLGDEDNGQMSAWYVFAAMGLYPVAPGVPEYFIGSPVFDAIDVRLEDGKQFKVRASNNAPDHVYVQEAHLNGVPYLKTSIAHRDVVAGGELVLRMGPTPSTWGRDPDAWPVSRTDGHSTRGPDRDVVGPTQIELQGCGPRASYPTLLTDNDASTVWYADSAKAQLLVHLGGPSGAPRVRQYTITTAGGRPACDPSTFRLESSDDNVHWTLIDSRHDEGFDWRFQTRGFALVRPSDARNYRLTVESRGGEACLQMAEFELLGGEG